MRARWAVFAAFFLVGQTLAAQSSYPGEERGVKPDKLYQFGELDSINLLNGNLTVRIPIGTPYPVGGSLSYGLTLVYNSKAWDHEQAYYQGQPYTKAVPDKLSNAGMGWSVSLGRLVNGGKYIGPDGAEHSFYAGLQTVGPVGSDPCASVCYSRDGSYLRMRTISSTQKVVEFPDGTKHTFLLVTLGNGTQEWRITEIRDRFEDGLTDIAISYSLDGNTWTIADKHGRQQKVIFGADPAGYYPRLLQRIELTAFGGAAPAVYQLSYLPPQSVSVPCSSNLPFWNSVSVSLLSSVVLPDGSSYGMTHYHPTDGGDCRARGLLASLYLPTLGTLNYTYRMHTLPVKGCTFQAWHSYTAGVATRKFYTAAGVDAGTWTYSSALSQPPTSPTSYACESPTQFFSPPPEELQVTVVTPLKDKSVHYFSVYPGAEYPVTSAFDERDYGLPFSRLPAPDATGNRFLSTQLFDCDAAGANCVLARSSYVRYERDADSRCDPLTGPGPACLDTNRRLVSQRTVYQDDGGRYADVDFSNFDGFGHYRTETTGGNFASGNQRTTFTNFNPGNVLPSASGAWVLGTFTEQTVTEGASTAKAQACFDPDTGSLKRQRIYSTGTSPSANDVVSVNTVNTAGQVVQQDSYGGDVQALALSTDLCNLTLPAATVYRLDHTYQYGTRRTSQSKDASGLASGSLAFKSLDRDIDLNTGQVATSRDSAGVATSFSVDAMGRLVSIKPQVSGEAWTQYTYVRALSGSRARLETRVCSSANTTTCTPIDQAQAEYDDFGRVARERQLMADGSWSKRVTTFDLGGNVATAADLQPDATADASLAKTVYSGYDVFGRPGTMTLPDGHTVTLSYAGVRSQTRTVTVGTGTLDAGGNIPETTASSTRIFDRQGRLWQVVESSSPTSTDVTTEYTYDVGNRISSVRIGAPEGNQYRYFTYDNLGFLRTDTHPEKAGLQRRFSGYDPFGNLGRVEDTTSGPNDVSFTYDRAGRLTQVRETVSGRVLKAFTYASANGVANSRRGKLETAKRTNYVTVGGVLYAAEVTQVYVYSGLGGRISQRGTYLVTNGTPGESFQQTFFYDERGNSSSLGSSRCSHTGCTGPAATERYVDSTYTNGFLTTVTGYAAISYHANGMVSQVQHTNGVTDTQGVDTGNWLPRPLSLSTSGASANWSTGTYRYDGAGNISKMGTDWFSYDRVSRLVRGVVHDGLTGGGAEKQQAYTYDTYGNIKQIATTSGGVTQTRMTPTSTVTNRLGGVAAYDNAGNLTGWNGAVYQYDMLNKMWRMQNGAEEWIYLYTADDERFWSFKVNANFSRWTIRDLEGHVLREYVTDAAGWSVAADYAYLNGRPLAVETPAGVRHFSLDHLGTPRLVTNSLAQKVAYHVYYPFGEEATAFNQDTERLKLTGHERDLASLAGPGDDLDYMHARFYNPQTARFHMFDPAGGNPDLPQTWNRYAYTLGNPLKYVDPDGRVEAGAFKAVPGLNMVITVVGRLEASPLLKIYHFASGAVNAFGSDLLFGRGLYEMNDPDYQSGQNFGHAAAVVAGVVEIIYGTGGEVVGFTLDATGVGAIVGVPVNVVSAGVISHGVVTSGIALSRGLRGGGGHRDKTTGANKLDRKKVDAAAREAGVKDRRAFGDYIEETKRESGRGPSDNFSYDELVKLAQEYKSLYETP